MRHRLPPSSLFRSVTHRDKNAWQHFPHGATFRSQRPSHCSSSLDARQSPGTRAWPLRGEGQRSDQATRSVREVHTAVPPEYSSPWSQSVCLSRAASHRDDVCHGIAEPVSPSGAFLRVMHRLLWPSASIGSLSLVLYCAAALYNDKCVDNVRGIARQAFIYLSLALWLAS